MLGCRGKTTHTDTMELTKKNKLMDQKDKNKTKRTKFQGKNQKYHFHSFARLPRHMQNYIHIFISR